jgi:serine/threonine protein kinase
LHLIKLLVTFYHCEQYHLLFPYADGNLLDFWKEFYPHPDIPKRGDSLAIWFSEQCLGLAQGLSMIHTADTPAKADTLAPITSAGDGRRHGRHGDLKPENILWFKNYTCADDMGVLKISDFGEWPSGTSLKPFPHFTALWCNISYK